MQTRIIDCKTKEMYCIIKPLREESELINTRYTFWATMNNIAMQNLTVQNLKRA